MTADHAAAERLQFLVFAAFHRRMATPRRETTADRQVCEIGHRRLAENGLRSGSDGNDAIAEAL